MRGRADSFPLRHSIRFRVFMKKLRSHVWEATSIWTEIGLNMQVTYQRLQAALKALGGGSGGDQLRPGTALAEVVFSGQQPRFQTSPPPWKPLNSGAKSTAHSFRQMSDSPISMGNFTWHQSFLVCHAVTSPLTCPAQVWTTARGQP